jgi:hypothetical protein
MPEEGGPPKSSVPAELLTLGKLLRRLAQERQDRKELEVTDVVADKNGLTSSGRLLLEVLASHQTRPNYDSASRELRWRGQLVKRLQRAGSNQLPVLLAFESQGWPARIDDPLPVDPGTDVKARLRETVRSLNERREWPVIRFVVIDRGVGWSVVEENEETS